MLLPKIAMLGCGWLGLPLARKLHDKGHTVVATRRSEAGKLELDMLGLEGIHYNLGDTLTSIQLAPLFNADLLIINVPLGRKTQQSAQFARHMTDLITTAFCNNIKRLIFVSTTSIYGDNRYQHGVTNIVEESPVYPNTESAKTHLAIEQFIEQHYRQNATIIRLAGLVGKNRHPANYLAGKTNLKNGNQIVNLIHQLDVIRAIENIIEFDVWAETLHLASTDHPTRQEYYSWSAKKLNLSQPEFLPCSAQHIGKKIDATLSLRKLKLELAYPSPFAMLDT